jgi:DNA topoisomerase VI subunit B
MEFCNRRELVNQTGHDVWQWALVVGKELTDNALDEAEDAGVAPVINIEVCGNKIVVTDNGRGIPASTVESVLNYSIRVSSREAYVSPTRGAQGNAIKTIIAMPFVLDGRRGRVEIKARGINHIITLEVDQKDFSRRRRCRGLVRKFANSAGRGGVT